MLDEEICKLRKQLNESIVNGEDYSITYKLSIELDELIAKIVKIIDGNIICNANEPFVVEKTESSGRVQQ